MGLILVWVIIAIYVVSLVASQSGQTIYDRLAGVQIVHIERVVARTVA